ncbi:endonuclease/exonuclease/phosphatase family protein [Blastomonas sp. UPD001]|uniref:endonuclease/exonuclease/phosphatase family protein n=1 Tax=Blastomonas sp. UPD001 TaxID=2217673 RepID=UPI000E348AD4|nr:endonuclease/exonuclease/phosphatase family protein [Blastomonas sp. UPD001]
MRLVTWNCNGAFRRKYQHLDQFDADVLVIQECEDPAQSTPDYRDWAGDYAWRGHNRNKGIGIFPRKGQSIEVLDWAQEQGGHFLPVKLDGKLTVLGVWTLGRKASGQYSYIGQFWHYLQLHKHRLGPDTIICGDLNSNAIWDTNRKTRNHMISVGELAEVGFQSLYHEFSGEAQGSELKPTFYLHRAETKAYHIDYVFVRQEALQVASPKITIGETDQWITISDHMPIVADIPLV